MPCLRSYLSSVFLLILLNSAVRAQTHSFQLIQTFRIGSPGGWDYIATGPDNKLYVSHGTHVVILDKKKGDSVGVIPNTPGVHGIAFCEALGKGYTSNGRTNSVSVFEIRTGRVLNQIPTGQNPDAILFEPFTRTIVTCNGRSHDLSVIDPATEQVIATIFLDGKPETAVSDEAGRLFVNIEDKNEITVVDMVHKSILANWSLAPGDGPTGLAIDRKNKRLFAGCDKWLMVMDAGTGNILAKLPIADGCDGVVFDSRLKDIFASCGEGLLTVVHESSPSSFQVIANVPTRRSARTLAIDEKEHRIFLPAAEMEKGGMGEKLRSLPGTFEVLVVAKRKH
ncbi:YncE family protein [Flavitalea sp. BT771]|uniref:YncE family protein n=1 Tax=Flavitalea sp. BT771 TaxID=3063329 RepID=UPI0026E2DA46|nr:YncE family protein [Flavitalea sp. BT771]MDO6431762.1 YncE family protein [Flavitalea sp. BT771]MDV6220670.1 YncE family protein [Flavitalea sp. BT771]